MRAIKQWNNLLNVVDVLLLKVFESRLNLLERCILGEISEF